MLKSVVVGALFAFVVLLNACSLDSESNYTPDITQGGLFRNQQGDTLRLKNQNAETVLDTIRVGDTVSMRFGLNAFSNNLKGFSVKQSADSVSRIIFPSKLSLDSIFSPESDYSKGLFVFKPNIQFVNFPFRYIATKSSMTAKLSLMLRSDANFGTSLNASNSVSVEIKTPIKPAIILY